MVLAWKAYPSARGVRCFARTRAAATEKTIEKVKLTAVEPVPDLCLAEPSESLFCHLDTVALDRECGVRPNDLRTRWVFVE
jgi:hypothetical protein